MPVVPAPVPSENTPASGREMTGGASAATRQGESISTWSRAEESVGPSGLPEETSGHPHGMQGAAEISCPKPPPQESSAVMVIPGTTQNRRRRRVYRDWVSPKSSRPDRECSREAASQRGPGTSTASPADPSSSGRSRGVVAVVGGVVHVRPHDGLQGTRVNPARFGGPSDRFAHPVIGSGPAQSGLRQIRISQLGPPHRGSLSPSTNPGSPRYGPRSCSCRNW